MAGATLRAHRQAARLGLLTALAGCAAMQDPPGGPADFAAPVLLNTRPDSGSVDSTFRERAAFEFDEVISEQSGGGLDRLVRISPRPEETDVSWKRRRLEVRPKGGWRPGTIYHLTLLPGIADLSNNRVVEGTTLVFSTGGPIPNTELSGTVIDWTAGRAAPRSLIEAVLMPDSLVYVTQADSAGDFILAALPQGSYHVFATVDGNTNAQRDRREPYDSIDVTLDSTNSSVFWAFVHDTAGPGLRTATLVDSVTVRLEFNQFLRPGPGDSGAVTVRLLPDSVLVQHAAVWIPATYDSVLDAEREAARVADSVAAAADTAQADSAAVDSVPDRPRPTPPLERRGGRGTGEQEQADSVRADTTRIQRLLAERPVLIDDWIVRFATPLDPGGRYVIDALVENVNGAMATARTLLIVPERPEPPDEPPP